MEDGTGKHIITEEELRKVLDQKSCTLHTVHNNIHPYLKVLILLLRQTLLGHHQRPQAFSGHVPTLRERTKRC